MRPHAFHSLRFGLIIAAVVVTTCWILSNRKIPRAQVGRGGTPEAPRTDPRHEVYFPYYTLRDGFDSSLVLIADSQIDFDLVLRGLSGHTVLSRHMTTSPNQRLEVDLGELIADSSEGDTGELVEGSAAVYFLSSAVMPLVAQITIADPQHGLSFESQMTPREMLPSELHAVWWGVAAGREARFVVSNTAATPASADVFLDFAGERHPSAPLSFKPHETKVLPVTQLLGDLNKSPAHAPEGGISIIPRDAQPTLIAQGNVFDPTSGFSTTLHFLNPAVQRSNSLHASGVPVATPSGDSPYAGDGAFTPHVIVRNLTSIPQTATVTVEYPGQVGPQETTLGPFPLAEYTTRDISLDAYFGLLPLPIPFCSVRIQYTGAPGAVVGEVSSIEKGEDLVVDSHLANEGDAWAGSGTNPWQLGEGTESLLFLTNMGEESTRIGFHLVAGNTNYYLTKLRLSPHQTIAIDLRNLRDSQEPDFMGNRIPSDAASGIVSWIRLDGVPVMGRMVIVQRGKGLASNYDCSVCDCCPNYIQLDVMPSKVYLVPGGTTALLSACAKYKSQCTSNNQYNYTYFDVTAQASWTSSSPSVATVDSNAQVKPVSVGTATITAKYSDNTFTFNSTLKQCVANKVTRSGTASANVTAPDHVSVVVDQEGYPAACPSTGIYLRQMQMQVVDASSNAIAGEADIQESFSNPTTNTCGNGQPVPSSCALTGTGGVGQFLDSMSVSGNLCGSGIRQSSGCGFSLTSTWATCQLDGSKTLWTSPRITHSNGVQVNGSWTTYSKGTQFH